MRHDLVAGGNADELNADALAAWAAELDEREQALAARERALQAAATRQPRQSLPAEPVAAALRRMQARGELDHDVAVMGAGLGLEPAWLTEVLDATAAELDVERIAQVCEALHCSPYELWGPELARTVLDAYGPERWPRYIEPLDEPRGDNQFLARRVAQQADAILTVAPALDGDAARRLSPREQVGLVRRFGQGGDEAARSTIVTLASAPDEALRLAVAARQSPEALAGVAAHYRLSSLQAAEELRRAGASVGEAIEALVALGDEPQAVAEVVASTWRIGGVDGLTSTARAPSTSAAEVDPGVHGHARAGPDPGARRRHPSFGARLIEEWSAVSPNEASHLRDGPEPVEAPTPVPPPQLSLLDQ